MTARVSKKRGFTLIELIVALSVVALLLTIGIPGFRELISDNRMATQYNDFVSALNSTRSEAIKRGMGVTICKRNAGGGACNNTGNWEDGWIIFTDLDRDGVVDENANETILRVHDALTGNNTLRASATRHRITYNGQGFPRGFADTFRLCDHRGVRNAKGMVISNNGRTRRAIDTNGDGIVDNGSGTSITCP